jgi:hypothetical protein
LSDDCVEFENIVVQQTITDQANDRYHNDNGCDIKVAAHNALAFHTGLVFFGMMEFSFCFRHKGALDFNEKGA